MPKATKKIVKVKKTAKIEMTPMPMMMTTPAPSPTMNPSMLRLALIVVLVGLLVYKMGPWFAPAMVGKRPITRFELWSKLEKSYGAQTLDDMVNERILDEAIEDANIKVDSAKIDAQVKTLETQFESTGGLDEALKQRGLSRKELLKQIHTQLAVEELLSDQIMPTDDEVNAQFAAGSATLYKDKKFEDVKASITDELKQAKLRDAFLAWFADVKKNAKVKNFGL